MTNRRFGADNPENNPVTEHLAPVNADDEFLSALAAGDASLRGHDPLAALLLDLKDEVDADLPAPPSLADLGLGEAPATDQFPATVASLDEKRSKRRLGNWASGLIGAAAATLVIAGGGTMISNAGVDSPLYGLNQQLFGGTSEEAVIQLASKLDEANKKSAAGDQDGARQLLDEARNIVQGMKPKDRPSAEADLQRAENNASKVTVTTTVTESVPVDATPVTVTTTVEPEAEATLTAEPLPQLPAPTVAPVQTPVPSVQPTETPSALPTTTVPPLDGPVLFN